MIFKIIIFLMSKQVFKCTQVTTDQANQIATFVAAGIKPECPEFVRKAISKKVASIIHESEDIEQQFSVLWMQYSASFAVELALKFDGISKFLIYIGKTLRGTQKSIDHSQLLIEENMALKKSISQLSDNLKDLTKKNEVLQQRLDSIARIRQEIASKSEGSIKTKIQKLQQRQRLWRIQLQEHLKAYKKSIGYEDD